MKRLWIAPVLLAALFAGGAAHIVQDQCGPFTDVTPAFCPFVSELYFLGITAGTSATTFSPDDPLTRGQAAVFVAKGLNQSLARSSRRAALGQWWTPSIFSSWLNGLGTTPLPASLSFGPVASDGADVWVGGADSVFRVRASDGKLLETWTIAKPASSILVAMGRVFVEGLALDPVPSSLYMIDPSAPPGAATAVADLPSGFGTLSFDGGRIWRASAAMSIVTPAAGVPWPVTTVTSGFQSLSGIVFDGTNIWTTDSVACSLLKLDGAGAIVQTVDLGSPCSPGIPAFDGASIVVPNGTLQVFHAGDGAFVANVPVANGNPAEVVFGGERLLVLSPGLGNPVTPSLTVFRSADFAQLQMESFPPLGGGSPFHAASDGLNFWVTVNVLGGDALGRY